ncbi:WbqC family protein [Psychroserpens sp.]|uniref:WbqC family protein n=1 Tax=Psychroserpens sp. TaxID=2020870 RepID=UPI001B0D31DE|nr:WbqC family protein [Psychroserpens sp.]MBO6606349.1 WbqC family protein [Psychroserpens sp.]MBO6653053.1 WbqC family protein [Psychroserpens sp.]MBO6680919.1 WbqC family protein [Psychroserpens sp.]MBO6750123.1 WbqC family protein [Psychroserpens sp.]MBO6914604.1 WbqC family protein [Psychroserpens sp.]
MEVLLHPTYFPNVAHFVAMLNAHRIVFEVCDNYQKQTYRNRTSIYGANGKLDLNIPVIYSQKNRQKTSNIVIYNEEQWQVQHLKSLESAYRTSPFYEFYIDDLMPLFERPYSNLMNFNFDCLAAIFDCLQLPFDYSKTSSFELKPICEDARGLAVSRKEIVQHFSKYAQVFDNKHGFIQNLSILDLLFNEGPNTELYLQAQHLNL